MYNKLYRLFRLDKVFRFLKKFLRNFKKAYRKLKFLDKTQLQYYVVVSFIGLFCTFTTTTYSVFTVSKYLNAAVITTAKLSYTLTSNAPEYNNGVVSVPAGETVILDLTLSSLNSQNTKYALNYSTNNQNISVYYSYNLENNMAGTIGTSGSSIPMRVVIVNSGSTAATVNLTVAGGYVNNTLESNITEGYYENDIVVRIIKQDADFTNDTQVSTFPTPAQGYGYYNTVCNEIATPVWDNSTSTLNLNNLTERIVCTAYFKAFASDIEVYYELRDSNGLNSTRASSVPNNGTYTFQSAHCSSNATANWNSTNWRLEVTGVQEKTICVALVGWLLRLRSFCADG